MAKCSLGFRNKIGLVRERTHRMSLCTRRDKSPGGYHKDILAAFFVGRESTVRMKRDWIYIFTAVAFEIIWVTGLKHAYNVLTWTITVIATIGCTIYLIKGTKRLPVGTAYAVFAGSGTGGAVLVEMLVFNEPFYIGKILFIGLLLVGVIGLQLVTDETEVKEVKGSSG